MMRAHPSWFDFRVCAGSDPELFFPERNTFQPGAEARRMCGACPVQSLCLETFLDEPRGIWGGYNQEDRARIAAGSAPAHPLHRNCSVCGTPFTVIVRSARECSERCALAARSSIGSRRLARSRVEWFESLDEPPHVLELIAHNKCVSCGSSYTPSKYYARFCGDDCLTSNPAALEIA